MSVEDESGSSAVALAVKTVAKKAATVPASVAAAPAGVASAAKRRNPLNLS